MRTAVSRQKEAHTFKAELLRKAPRRAQSYTVALSESTREHAYTRRVYPLSYVTIRCARVGVEAKGAGIR